MISLHQLLLEVDTPSELSPKEKAAYNDLISSLEEASGDSFLAKVGEYAKQGLLKGALLAALLASPKLGQAQKAQIQDLAKDATTQTAATDYSKWEAKRYVSDKKMEDWNDFTDWLRSTKVEDLGIATKREGSGVLAGNPIMDHEDYSDAVIEAYRKGHTTTITKADVKPIQKQLGNYRDWTIATYIKNGKDTNKKNPVQFNFKVADNYSNYMSFVLKSGEDGIVGINTSRVRFPHEYLTDLDKGTTADLGFAK
jgi:hypothetical protein